MKKPRLFDLQVNGFAGVDFQSEGLDHRSLAHAVSVLEKYDTAGILATLITDSIDAMCRKLETFERLRAQDGRIESMIKGYHLEGPWISREPGYFGAHPLELACLPRLEDLKRLHAASGGNLKLITLAPEIEGGIAIIEAAVAMGIRIGLGHTNASAPAIDEAIRAGATLATHLGNAVPAQMHRHDNVMQRLLARDELIACLIPDGIHLPPFLLKNFYRAKPAGRTFFTTDCMSAAGSPPGVYRLAGYELEVGEDGIVHLPGDERFAGSSLTMDAGLRNVIDWLGVDESEALAMCGTRAAAHFGIKL